MNTIGDEKGGDQNKIGQECKSRQTKRSPFVVNFNHSWQALQGLQAFCSVKTSYCLHNFRHIVALKKGWNLSIENTESQANPVSSSKTI